MTKAILQEALAELPDEFSLDELMKRLMSDDVILIQRVIHQARDFKP